MATLDIHLRRTIELETELRLVKEQLTRAQQGTQYLVNCFTTQPAHHGFNERSEVRIRELEVENAVLRRQLARIADDDGTGSSYFSRGELNFKGGWNSIQQRQDRRALVEAPHRVDSACEDLVDFGDERPSKLPNDKLPLSVSRTRTGHHRSNQIHDTNQEGLGIRIPGPTYNTSIPPPDLLSDEVSPNAPVEEEEQWLAIRPPPPSEQELVFDRPFHNWEHSKIFGMATFIEDMSDGEQEHYFKMCEEKDKRHSAKEWRKYYEAVVRPKFLARTGGVGRSVGGKSVGGGSERAERAKSTHRVSQQNDLGQKQSGGPGLQGMQESRWAPRLGHDIEKTLGEVKLSHPSNEQGTPPSRESSNQGPNLTPDTDSTPRADDDAEALSSALNPEQDDLLLCSPTPKKANPSILSPSPQAPPIPETATKATERADREPSTRGRSKARSSRGRRRARTSSASVNGSGLFHEWGSPNPELYRTVMITNVPTTMMLATVVNKVRGGRIVDAKYLETAGMRTQPPITTNTVLVEFLHANDAATFVQFTQKHDILLFHDDAGSTVKLTARLMDTPSRRLPPGLYHNMHQRGLTRVLFIVDKDEEWETEEVIEELQGRHPELKKPLSAGGDENGVLYFKFADVRDAGNAWEIVNRDARFFHGASKGFWPDPCARQLKMDSPGTTSDAGESSDDVGAEEDACAGEQAEEGAVVEIPGSDDQASGSEEGQNE